MTALTQSGDVATSHPAPSKRSNPIWLTVVLLVLVAAVGGVIGRMTAAQPAPVPDLASPSVRTMVERQIAAVNSGDATRIAPFYAAGATLTDIGNRYAAPVRGRDKIAKVLAADVALFGPFLDPPGTLVQKGSFVTYAGTWGDVNGGVVVYELDAAGKILNQWAMHSAD